MLHITLNESERNFIDFLAERPDLVDGLDPYCLLASERFQCEHDEVSQAERSAMKRAVLMYAYGG